MTVPYKLPAAALVDAVEARGGPVVLARRRGHDHSPGSRLIKAYRRAKASGTITDTAADTLCIELLGEHPVLVFGDTWLLDADGPTDDDSTCAAATDEDLGAGDVDVDAGRTVLGLSV